MTDFEDRLRRTMQAHSDQAPSVAELAARLPRPRRRSGPQRWQVAASVAAVVLLVAGLSLAWSRGGSRHGVASARTQSAGPATPDRLTCPATFGVTHGAAGGLWVPADPSGVDGSASLTPDIPPTSAVICGYVRDQSRASTPPDYGFTFKLTGHRELTGDLSAITSQLSSIPPAPEPDDRSCTTNFVSTDGDNYLLGLTFAGGTEWISVPGQHCDGSGNGQYSTDSNLLAEASGALSSGRWESPSRTGPCQPGQSGRTDLGQKLLAPAPTSVSLCLSQGPDHDKVPSRTLTTGFSQLTSALLALPVQPSSGSCLPTPGSKGGDSYTLDFSYPSGPDIVLYVLENCVPEIMNYANHLQATSTAILPIVQQLIGSPH